MDKLLTMSNTEMKMNYGDFEKKFGEWATMFKPFIESPEMFKIYAKLKADTDKRIQIVPDSEVVFRSFELTSPEKVKCIWYLMDPYSRRYPGRKKINQA